jgi:hypothetical protein
MPQAAWRDDREWKEARVLEHARLRERNNQKVI